MCLVDKGKLLVYGLSAGNDRIFELHQFSGNSPNQVFSVKNLATETRDFIMHSCDYTGGAWLRSTNPEEEHAFYDPGTDQLYKNNGSVTTSKLLSVSNSKRGHYFTVYWQGTWSSLQYSTPINFWKAQIPGVYVWTKMFLKFIRLDVANTNNLIYYVGLLKEDVGDTYVTPLRS